MPEKGEHGELYIPRPKRVQDVNQERKEEKDPIDDALDFSDKMLASEIKRSAAAQARADRARAEAEARKAEKEVEKATETPPPTPSPPQEPSIKLTMDLGEMIRAKDQAIEAAQKATSEMTEKYFSAQAQRLEDMIARVKEIQAGGAQPPKTTLEYAQELVSINKEFESMFPKPGPTTGIDAASQIKLKELEFNLQTQLKSMDQTHQIAMLEAQARLEEIKQQGLRMQMDAQKGQDIWGRVISTLGAAVTDAARDYAQGQGRGPGAPPHPTPPPKVGETPAGINVFKCLKEDCGFNIPVPPGLVKGEEFECPNCGSRYVLEE